MFCLFSHPILDPAAAGAHESRILQADEEREWAAMQAAGSAVAAAMRRDLAIRGPASGSGRVLVLAGKGHNAGDALIAATALARERTGSRIEVGFVFGERKLRPLAFRAWRELQQIGTDRVARVEKDAITGDYDVILDGIFGFQFRPPLAEPAIGWLKRARGVGAGLRAAVDLPTGLGDPQAFVADATYATGVVKTPLMDLPSAGRVRYLDLGFFRGDEPAEDRVLTPEVLEPLRALRPARSDKRGFGHLFVAGGSREFPGAVLMSVQGALRSGAGLVTAFVPESLAPAYAAAWPEAIWVGCPETEDGGLAIDGVHLVRTRWGRADALLIGPGLGREPETLALVAELVRHSPVPLVLDADALQPEIVSLGQAPRVLTPHAGEFARLAKDGEVRGYRPVAGAVTVLKGPVTRLSDGSGTLYHSFAGGPVLARGGSGDILAGMIGTLLAAETASAGSGAVALRAAARAVVWHGCAADLLAQERGEVAVRTTELLDFLGRALAG